MGERAPWEKTSWEEIRLDYIMSDEKQSCRDLAAKYNASKSGIHKKMVEDNWDKDRNKYHTKLMARVQDSVIADKLRRRERALGIIDFIIDKGGKSLLEKISKGEKDLTIPQLSALIELEMKLSSGGDEKKDLPKKKLNKKLEDCTMEELDLVTKGEAVCVPEGEIDYGKLSK